MAGNNMNPIHTMHTVHGQCRFKVHGPARAVWFTDRAVPVHAFELLEPYSARLLLTVRCRFEPARSWTCEKRVKRRFGLFEPPVWPPLSLTNCLDIPEGPEETMSYLRLTLHSHSIDIDIQNNQ